jgi:protein Tex
MERHGVGALALGNGVGCAETEAFLARALLGMGSSAGAGGGCGWAVVSEAGASVYSASDLARQELPGLETALRGAVSIARRLQVRAPEAPESREV